MSKKVSVAIVCGGKSAEHEVSLVSARLVAEALNKDKYDVRLVMMDRDGRLDSPGALDDAEVVFPLVHGTHGEDGCLQGWLKIRGLPFVGAGVLGSAVGMDKDVTKRLLKGAGLPIVDFLCCHAHETIDCDHVATRLGLPVFVKPASLGSSIGVTRVDHLDQLSRAIQHAFVYDRKIIIEKGVLGREIECAVLGNEDPIASLPGEVIVHSSFYSYEAKYLDPQGATVVIPAPLSEEMTVKIQDMAKSAYRTLCCSGMARVDFFLQSSGEIFINELNTLPGFTPTSMYPKMWEATGLPYTELLDKLIVLAFDKFHKELELKTTYL